MGGRAGADRLARACLAVGLQSVTLPGGALAIRLGQKGVRGRVVSFLLFCSFLFKVLSCSL